MLLSTAWQLKPMLGTAEQQQQAQSRKYSSEHKVWLVELDDTWALFAADASLIWIGQLTDLPLALASRPSPKPRPSNTETKQELTKNLLADLGLA